MERFDAVFVAGRGKYCCLDADSVNESSMETDSRQQPVLHKINSYSVSICLWAEAEHYPIGLDDVVGYCETPFKSERTVRDKMRR